MVFAEKVHRLLTDRKLRQQLSTKALAYVQQKWTSRVQAERLVDFYQDLTQ